MVDIYPVAKRTFRIHHECIYRCKVKEIHTVNTLLLNFVVFLVLSGTAVAFIQTNLLL